VTDAAVGLLSAVVTCSALILGPVQLASGQAPPCDPGLVGPSSNPYAYGPRGDRCEGVYVKQVGGTLLSVASLTTVFDTYDLTSTKSLSFAWSAAGDSGLRIRVRGIDRDLYYGMDVRRPAGVHTYAWPANILSQLRITRPRIGALGWTRRNIDGAWRDVYVPLRITQADNQAPSTGCELALFAGTKLKEVYITLGPADSAGRPQPGKLIKDHEPQNQLFYPPERPIRIRLPPLTPPGIYYLEVSATLPDDSPVPVEPLLIDASSR
jgi:hypothetical protein